nr:PREDICTED: uncharacterized protein LOC109032239 [Bemisia tabaci]
MKFTVSIALILALFASAQALPSRMGRQEEAAAVPEDPAAAAAPAEPAAVAEDAPAAPVAEAAVAPEGDKHAHEHEHEHKPTHHEHKPTHHEHKPAPTHYESEPEHYYEVSKPQVHPHPINLHAILTALKYVGPVVGDLIQPFALNIVHAIIGAITETLSSGFSMPTPHHYPVSYPEPHHHE